MATEVLSRRVAAVLRAGPMDSLDAQSPDSDGPGPDSVTGGLHSLNAEGLQRARQGLESSTPGPGTTPNLNRMSEQHARRGQALPQPAMPFR